MFIVWGFSTLIPSVCDADVYLLRSIGMDWTAVSFVSVPTDCPSARMENDITRKFIYINYRTRIIVAENTHKQTITESSRIEAELETIESRTNKQTKTTTTGCGRCKKCTEQIANETNTGHSTHNNKQKAHSHSNSTIRTLSVYQMNKCKCT